MTASYGDVGRDALLAVSTQHLGWRLSEVVREVPGLSRAAAAQGIEDSRRAVPNSRRWPWLIAAQEIVNNTQI